jgi:hypothetical protein
MPEDQGRPTTAAEKETHGKNVLAFVQGLNDIFGGRVERRASP